MVEEETRANDRIEEIISLALLRERVVREQCNSFCEGEVAGGER